MMAAADPKRPTLRPTKYLGNTVIDEREADADKADFHRAVFDILDIHSRLDLNLGLCIVHLTHPEEPSKAYEDLRKLSSFGKIEALRRIVKKETANSFEQWRQNAVEVRAIRNEFAHGVWEYLPANSDAPVGLRMPPWFSRDDRVQARFAVTEIQELALEAKACFDDFVKWRRNWSI
jgi:hypothetical protein